MSKASFAQDCNLTNESMTMIKSLFLTADPSALYGAARVFDLGAVFDEMNTSESEDEADTKALYSDWKSIGDELRRCMSEQQSTR